MLFYHYHLSCALGGAMVNDKRDLDFALRAIYERSSG